MGAPQAASVNAGFAYEIDAPKTAFRDAGRMFLLKKGLTMNEAFILSGWNLLFIGGPLILFLIVAFFRLDEMVGTGGRVGKRVPLAFGLDEKGNPIPVDPDGQPIFADHRSRQVR